MGAGRSHGGAGRSCLTPEEHFFLLKDGP